MGARAVRTNDRFAWSEMNRRRWLWFALVLAGALVIRLAGPMGQAFWYDEVCSDGFSQGGLQNILINSALDTQPPLYYLGLSVWRLLGPESEAFLRGYSVLWSLVGLVGLFALALEIFGFPAAMIALVLAAVNPLDVHYALEARMHSQASALCVWGAWIVWRWMLADQRWRERPAAWAGWMAAYVAVAIAALLTHYMCLMALVAQGMYALTVFAVRRHWKSALGYLSAIALVALCVFPWLMLVIALRGGADMPVLDGAPPPAPADYLSFLGKEFFWGHGADAESGWWAVGQVLAAAILMVTLVPGLPGTRQRPPVGRDLQLPDRLYPVWLLFAPIAILFAVHSMRLYPSLTIRPGFVLLVLPPFLILAGKTCVFFRSRAVAIAVGAVLAGLMLVGTARQWQTDDRVDWRAVAELWRREGPPAAIILPTYRHSGAQHSYRQTLAHYLDQPVPHLTPERLLRMKPYLAGDDLWVCLLDTARHGQAYNWIGSEVLQAEELAPGRLLLAEGSLSIHAYRLREPAGPSPAPDGRLLLVGPFDKPGSAEGFEDPTRFYGAEFDKTQAPFRWSRPEAWVRLRDLSDQATTAVVSLRFPDMGDDDPYSGRGPALRLYIRRDGQPADLFAQTPAAILDRAVSGAFEVALPVPPGPGDVLIGWRSPGISSSLRARERLQRRQGDLAPDERIAAWRQTWLRDVNLGLMFRWIGVYSERPDPANLSPSTPAVALAPSDR